MSWWGKAIGGAFGFLLGGPLGALFGASVGHQFDKGLNVSARATAGEQTRVQTAFFTATFSVMGHVAKADGHVSPDEIAMAEAIMQRMDLTGAMRQAAVRLFNEGKSATFPIDAALAQFRHECHGRRHLLLLFLEIQVEAALADGVVHAGEGRVLRHIAQALGLMHEFARIESMLGAGHHYRAESPHAERAPSLDDAYALLGVTREASDDDVKRAYRRLMNRHHPDKLIAKGVPEEMVRVATEQTQEIRKAYERIRQFRGRTTPTP